MRPDLGERLSRVVRGESGWASVADELGIVRTDDGWRVKAPQPVVVIPTLHDLLTGALAFRDAPHDVSTWASLMLALPTVIELDVLDRSEHGDMVRVPYGTLRSRATSVQRDGRPLNVFATNAFEQRPRSSR